ncbi:hypothetical protein [Gloeobacter violaceus]|uniref:Glr3749 protein n=1 Tax=Gloeobacter violaceus (strain ATCC 29082 / PCC 7421) TaxID=251221 RepID=Q7NEX8_GLOVI|nr:hypothetical protein [Gloeobacter violaceus]BAC91690.1 glr3749 [Gloeobacter violaceus PCC 7421]
MSRLNPVQVAALVTLPVLLGCGMALAQPKAIRNGEVRVGNKTPYPVRVVVTKADGSLEGAFWDFAPGEGGTEGIRLALADRPIVLGEGDVITIFTVDGSRRYWGPSIIGRTNAPFWDAKRRLWTTVLRP